jgi:putative transposase
MARLPRLVVADHPHLLVQRALAVRPAFVDSTDRQRYLDTLREALAAEGVQLHAYALLADEVRLLLTPRSTDALGRLMQAIGRRYVSAYNRRHGRAGTLWEGRFRCAVVEPGPSCLDAMLWVAGSSQDPDATSGLHHIGARRDGIVTDPPEYWSLGNTPFERELAFRQRLSAGLPPARAAQILRCAHGGWAIGSPTFADAMAAACGRPTRPRPRGRPPLGRPGS